MKKDITLTVNGVQMSFRVDTPNYNRYLNELQPTNKIGPAENFLRRCVTEESREALKTALELPGASLAMVHRLMDEYMPDLEIEVGKSSPTPMQ